MKVNLAAQAVSSSTADVLKLKQFHGCEATVKFIRLFRHLFEMLNSRNPFAQGYKSALRVASKSSCDPFVTMIMTYDCILHLKDSSGQLLHSICRKSGFIGLLAAIKSAKA